MCTIQIAIFIHSCTRTVAIVLVSTAHVSRVGRCVFPSMCKISHLHYPSIVHWKTVRNQHLFNDSLLIHLSYLFVTCDSFFHSPALVSFSFLFVVTMNKNFNWCHNIHNLNAKYLHKIRETEMLFNSKRVHILKIPQCKLKLTITMTLRSPIYI